MCNVSSWAWDCANVGLMMQPFQHVMKFGSRVAQEGHAQIPATFLHLCAHSHADEHTHITGK